MHEKRESSALRESLKNESETTLHHQLVQYCSLLPDNLSKEEKKELHKQARKITWLYSGSRIFLAFLAIIEPLLIVEVKDIVLLAGYCVIWFALAFCILQFRTHKRRKIKL